MNKIMKKNQFNKIIIMLVIIMLCNFIMPSYSYAINGGIFFKPISQLIAHVADLVIQGLQLYFIGSTELTVGPDYTIRYSPGIIFSGEIPAFDINFINPAPDYKVEDVEIREIGVPETKKYTLDDLDMEDPGQFFGDNSIILEFFTEGILRDGKGRKLITTYKCRDTFSKTLFDQGWITSTGARVEDILNAKDVKFIGTDSSELDIWINPGNDGNNSANIGPVIYEEKEYKNVRLQVSVGDWTMPTEDLKGNFKGNVDIDLKIYYYEFEDNDGNYSADCYLELEIGNATPIEYYLGDTGRVIESTAKQLQVFIATWYRVLKEVALVGLLSVLVYVAIRMILSSTAQGKAKYKKMLVSWFTAICIIFVMQYFISLIITITSSISKFFSADLVGEYGEDRLMSAIRYNVGESDTQNFMTIFADIVMYVVLVVYTVMFTIQYLKRTIYIAFLTLISPLVAFTYPLDKMKDGKAQAFSTWLREFIYSSLIQPIHLILYIMLVNSAKNFVQEIPIYAIIVIGFLLPAEKFVKKMFGLDRSNTVGNMASAIGGASVMNLVNKLGSKGPKGKSGGGSSEKSSGENKVRMANEGAGDPYEALRGNGGAQPAQTPRTGANTNGGTGTQSPSPERNPNSAPNPAQSPAPNSAPNPAPSPAPNSTPNSTPNPAPSPTQSPTQNTTGNNGGGSQNTNKRSVKKAGSKGQGVGKKYTGKVVKGIIKGTARVAGAATLGTIGLAAGIATGEIENAFAGAAGGLAAGNRLGGSLVEGGSNIIKGASKGAKGIKDTYREGKYGKEEADRMKFDEEFRKSEGYKNLMETYPGQEQTAQEFLNAGITDTKKMGKAMKNLQSGKYNAKEAIAYMKMAEKCPDEILYDDQKFANYLSVYGIDLGKAEEIRRNMVEFK